MKQEKENVQVNESSTPEKIPGGCTGKGFLPGQSGNPGGKSKKKWLTEMAEELLEEICSDEKQREEFKAALKAKMLSKGVVSAMTLDKIWERTEGKVPQDLNLGGEVNLNLADSIAAARQRLNEE